MYDISLLDANVSDREMEQLISLEKEYFQNSAIRRWELTPFVEVGWILVAYHLQKRGKEPVAVCEGLPTKNHDLYIYGIGVRSDHRGKGLANLLLQTAEELYIKHLTTTSNESTIYLYVSPNNHDAIKLYQNFGMKQTAKKRHFFGKNEHRVRMEKKIGNPF